MLNLSQIEELFDSSLAATNNPERNEKIKKFYREYVTDLLKSLRPRNIIYFDGTQHPKAVEAHNDLAREQREKIDQALK